MNRTVAFGVLALAVAACDDRPNAPTSPRAEAPRAARVGAPAPSPLISVPLPGQTLALWPFTGFGFGEQSDPVNLMWIGQVDPRELRAALVRLNGDRTAFGFPDVFPFNCTWHDEPEVQPELAYSAASGWVGSPIMLECGTFDQARFHLRFFDVGRATVGGAPFEVFIPGTLDHQTISWALAEQFVVADFVRTGLLDPTLPFFTTGPINPAPFGTIPAVIYNGIPTALRQAIGGPLGDVTDAVPIASSGHATVLMVTLLSTSYTAFSLSRPVRTPRGLALAHGEPTHAAVGVPHHPSAGRQRPRDDELAPIGGAGSCRHDGYPHQQREQAQLQHHERGCQPCIHADEHR